MAGGKHILGKAKRHIFGTAKVGEKGQIVIPKDARQIFGVKPGDTLESVCTLTKNRGAFYFIDAKGYVDGKLCVSAELSFALVENK